MDIILLGVTIISLAVALVMSAAAWRVTRDEKKRSAARVAALTLAANTEESSSHESVPLESFSAQEATREAVSLAVKPPMKAPWSAPPLTPRPSQFATAAALRRQAEIVAPAELTLHEPRIEPVRFAEPSVSHVSGFLGAAEVQRDSGSRQKSLAIAALILFAVLSGGLMRMMSAPRGTSAAAVGPNSPLELVSLSHERKQDALAVSGLVRNPAGGQPVQNLSAVVFLFDRSGTFVVSSRANVDFLKLGAGDETPFVVSLDAPATVARYRVSFRTDDGVVPHIDRRGEAVGSQESVVKSSVVSQQ